MTSCLDRSTFALAIAALGLAASLMGVAPRAAAQTIAEIRSKGELRVGVLVDFPPYGSVDALGQPDGYDADVARLLARDLGVKLSLVPVTGPNRIPLLLDRRVDLLIASLVATPERSRQVRFSQPYSLASIVLYGSASTSIRSVADLRGLRVGAVRGSSEDLALTTSAPQGTELRRFDDDAHAVEALISARLDAIACSPNVAARIARRVPPHTFEDKFLLRRQQMAAAVRPRQHELLAAVDAFIARQRASGELDRLYRKWLEGDSPAMK